MNTPFFIAKRYLVAKKSHNLINIITWISIVSISVAAFALIVVLSAFNGIENVVATLNNRLAPDLLIASEKGKTIDLKAFPLDDLASIDGVSFAFPSLTEDALFRANDKQHIGQVKGIASDYERLIRFQEASFDGEPLSLIDSEHAFAIPGSGVAWYLGINAYDPYAMLRVYVPKRGVASTMNLENSFNSDVLSVGGVFSTQQEMDEQLVLVPFEWLSGLLEYDDKATDVEIFLKSKSDLRKVKRAVSSRLGDGYTIKDQREQQETLYKIMRSEKWAVYIILTFILILATFNVIGSLSMLMIEKRKDSATLSALGADRRFRFRLFMDEGLLIALAGGLVGLFLGVIVVLLQQQFGFVKFGSSGNYIVEAYPVMLKLKDVLLILATILAVGGVSAWLTVRHALKRETSLDAQEG